ncbi:MAG: TonB family protein [Spirochaetota bacterium]|nr:TonB family protein [Spirochaetota bacterium]
MKTIQRILLYSVLLIFPLTGVSGEGLSGKSPAGERKRILFILDCSQSMAKREAEGYRFSLAKGIIRSLMKRHPDNHYALMVYGMDSGKGCEDVRLSVPFGVGSNMAIDKTLNEIEPRGSSPLGMALRKGLTYLSGFNERSEIVLVSDGPGNCGIELSSLSKRMNQKDVRLRAALLYFSEREKRLVSSLNEVAHRKIVDYHGGLRPEGIVRILKPSEPVKVSKARKITYKSATKPRKVPKMTRKPVVFVRAKLLKGQSQKPRYPYLAKRYGLEGKVTLGVYISVGGKVYRVKVLKSSGHKLLDEAAIETAQTWLFRPAQRDGRVSRDYLKIRLVFNLQNEELDE